MKKINRRKFLQTSGLMTLMGMGGMQVGFGQTRGASSGSNRDLLVYVFLNGGMDGLNMVPPRTGPDFTRYSTTLRPTLHIPLAQSIPIGNGQFGLHPMASELATLFNQNKMAIVHATGLLEANRSHFVATAMMELGVQSSQLGNTGWLTRYFNSSFGTPDDALIPSMVPSYNTTDAVLGDPAALVMGDPNSFALTEGFWQWNEHAQNILKEIYSPVDSLEKIVGFQTLNASDIVAAIDWDNYVPGNGAVYPDGFFGQQLNIVAQLYKSNVDLEVAYVPYGGWDTHVDQGTGSTGVFAELTEGLSQGLYALYQDLSATHPGRFTIVVQSEFGRRAYQNGDGGGVGSDHGYGNPMFVIGDNVNGGFFGQFPGLGSSDLFEGQDVNVNVDYRDVISEVLIKRMRNRFLGYIFPDYSSYNPLGVVNGADLPPHFDPDIDRIYDNSFD